MLFLTLSPFAAFALLMAISTAPIALLTAGCLSLALLLADYLRGRSLKVLQVAAASVFGALCLYLTIIGGQLEPHLIRAAVDVVMLAVGLFSLLLRAPFTMQYACETVTPDIAARPEFLRVNALITWVWCAACVAMLAANFASMLAPWLPLWTGLAVAFVARSSAAAFTQWYAGLRYASLGRGQASSDHPSVTPN